MRRKATKSNTSRAEALTPAQEQAATLLAGGASVTDAASTVGVHRSTVHEWLRLPAFRALVDDLRRDALRSAADLIRSNLGKAARVVASILDSPEASDRDKLMAAGIAYKVAGNGLPGLEVPREPPPPSLDALALQTAQRANEMVGGSYFSMEDQRTPGTAWAKAGLNRAFPDSYAKLRTCEDDPEEAAAYCAALLEAWRAMIDEDALEAEKGKNAGRARHAN